MNAEDTAARAEKLQHAIGKRGAAIPLKELKESDGNHVYTFEDTEAQTPDSTFSLIISPQDLAVTVESRGPVSIFSLYAAVVMAALNEGEQICEAVARSVG